MQQAISSSVVHDTAPTFIPGSKPEPNNSLDFQSWT